MEANANRLGLSLHRHVSDLHSLFLQVLVAPSERSFELSRQLPSLSISGGSHLHAPSSTNPANFDDMDAFSKLSGKKKGRRSKRRLQEQGPEMELERADENSNTGGRNQVPVNTEEHVYRGAVAGNNPSASLNIDTYDPFMLAVERYNNSGHVRDWPVARASANNEQQIIRPAFPHARRGLSLLPRWEQDIIIRSQTTRECLFDFLATIPAILYTITALVPLIELPEIAIRHGFRIANGVMFCFLIVLGYWGERFKPEK